jgi:hypothetical protein
LERTKNIRFAGSTATGFLHNDSLYSYLVTVRHLFQEKKSKLIIKGSDSTYITYDSILVRNNSLIEVEVYNEKKWKPLKGTIHFFRTDSCNIDIAIIKFYKTGTWSSIYFSDESKFLLGQRCFFAGYPLNLKTPTSIDLGYTFPIIKSAIISGTIQDTIAKHNAILLDGNNTFGLSGSPLFFYNYYLKKWRIAGVVTSYYVQKTKIFNSKTGEYEIREENSGIAKAVFSNYVIELINRTK